MNVLRSIASILVGYFLKIVLVGLFFVTAGWQSEGILTQKVVLLGILWRALSSIIAGFFAGVIAGRKEVTHALVLALLAATGAIFSMAVGKGGQEPLWAQITNLVIMVPMVVLGGFLRERQKALMGGPED